MKMLKNTCNLWTAILSLISVFSCLTIVGYASEKNDKISVTTETASLITNSQDQIERSLEKSNMFATNEYESYPSGFSRATILNGIYYIKNIGTGKYIDIHGPSTDMIHQWTYHVNLQENWEITKLDDGYYTIRSLYKDKYIGVANTRLGVDNINLYSSVSNQTKWVILKNSTGQYTFVPYNNIAYMLCAPNNLTGEELQLTNNNLSNNYNKWILIEQVQNSNTNLIQNIETRRFASPYGPYLDDGTRIHQWDFSTSSARRWIFQKQSDYFFTIKDKYTQKYMGFAEDEDGSIYIEQFSSISDCAKWKMYKSSSENLVFTPKGYEPYSYAISVNPSYDNVGSILKLIPYTDDTNYKDEWQLITDRTYLGSLSTTWHSDSRSVGYWDLDGTLESIDIYSKKLNAGELSFYFTAGTNEAIRQWEDLLNINIDKVYNEDSADIRIYGGTREQIEDIGGFSGTTWAGLSKYWFSYQGIMNINGGNEIVNICRISSSLIHIISRTDTDSVRMCIAHELGHSLGYFGHAPYSTDVMYAYLHGSYTLKTLESNHIKAIYLLYNK